MYHEKPQLVEIKVAEAVITSLPFRIKFLKLELEVLDGLLWNVFRRNLHLVE